MKNCLIVMLILSGLNLFECVNVKSNYSDTCDYNSKFLCGDICVDLWDSDTQCNCDGDLAYNRNTIDNWHPHYCCTPPSVKCRKTLLGVFCPEGEVLEADHFYNVYPEKFDIDGATPCHGRCYNDYFTSEYHSPWSHYTCPDKCVHWSGMCRGVSYCEGDQEICGEDLRCSFTKYTMDTDPPRSYCFGQTMGGNLVSNDGGYDNLDRSDEEIKKEIGSRPNINYTGLIPCADFSTNELYSLTENGFACDNYNCCFGFQHWCKDFQSDENFDLLQLTLWLGLVLASVICIQIKIQD